MPCAAQQPSATDESFAQAIAAVYAHRLLLGGERRSHEFRAGFEAQLAWWAKGSPKNACAGVPPYRIGTASADAWWAGWDAATNPLVRGECLVAIEEARMIAEGAL